VTGFVGAAARLLDGEVPLRPDREQARGWAQTELLRPEYQAERPSLIRRLLDWLSAQLDRLTGVGGPPGNITLAIVAVLLVALVGYLLWRSGGVRRNRRRGDPDDLFEGAERTAAQYRAAADAAQADGDLATAVLERFRGIVRGLQERALLDRQPGRTADEAARAAGGWLPDLAVELAAAARAFDDVRYGDRPAGVQVAESLRDLDLRVQAARPAPTAGPAATIDVPR
jgi:hypothetical protein